MLIRAANFEDLETIHQLNESVLPHVNSISMVDFEEFLKVSSFFVVIEANEEIVAFMIVLGPAKTYKSENYQFYCNKYQSFDYVDRIVVDIKSQRYGYGRALYDYLKEHSNEERITCEVNLNPPNPVSQEFHKIMGFFEVGQLNTKCGKLVSLLVKEI